MKQGLSLRVSQHLALTPQLQQSIRLLQLSTLELGQEVEQMLDDNPFLEREQDELPRDAFGLPQADSPPIRDESEQEPEAFSTEDSPGWDGDGSVSLTPDDSEWGGGGSGTGQ